MVVNGAAASLAWSLDCSVNVTSSVLPDRTSKHVNVQSQIQNLFDRYRRRKRAPINAVSPYKETEYRNNRQLPHRSRTILDVA